MICLCSQMARIGQREDRSKGGPAGEGRVPLYGPRLAHGPHLEEDPPPQKVVGHRPVVPRVRGVPQIVPLQPHVPLWHRLQALVRPVRRWGTSVPFQGEEPLAHQLPRLVGAHRYDDVPPLQRLQLPRDVVHQHHVPFPVERRYHARPLGVRHLADILVHQVQPSRPLDEPSQVLPSKLRQRPQEQGRTRRRHGRRVLPCPVLSCLSNKRPRRRRWCW
mmetsp:Transcript_9225/g.26226  ORF Transcript_9225/g.26226 Transcript_9225/m.26226 type:complete len:218 (-) Transcript_9225:244-897(-)